MTNGDDAVRILIADDHEMIRAGLRHVVELHGGWRVCGEAASGREAVQLARKFMPHVVIVDLIMPELNGFEATRQIKKHLPQTEVLVFSILESDDVIHQMLEAGARGYLVKSDHGRHIVEAIEALVQHRPYFTASVLKMLVDASLCREQQAIDQNKSNTNLTPREREVLQLLGEGYGNKACAARLGITVKTMETHRATILRKLDIHSMAELVRYAVRNNIIAV
jgi:DNA-binding NarL/FixJ family response regulator